MASLVIGLIVGGAGYWLLASRPVHDEVGALDTVAAASRL
jgi:hypothetical protein